MSGHIKAATTGRRRTRQWVTQLLSLIMLLSLTHCGGGAGYKSIHYSPAKLATPSHSMPRHEYPFDSRGNYRKDWVRAPAGSSSSRTRSSSSSSSSRSSSSSSRSSGSSSSRSSARYHKVSSGDTLWGISQRYKTSVSAVKRANGLKSDIIRPGQTLRIP